MTANPTIDLTDAAHGESSAGRATELFEAMRQTRWQRIDRLFAGLMLAQWAFAILLAVVISPYAWDGKVRTVHLHVQLAIFLGGILTALPVALARLRPGWVVTRHVIAIAQGLWSALFIHLTGGRIETHFHVFGSLAFLAFYLDWPVLLTGTLVVATDHFFRGLLWPESVYGIVNPAWWRFLEHAGWVVFEDTFLVLSCISGTKDVRHAAERQAEIEAISEREQLKSAALEMTLAELRAGATGT